MSITDSLGKDAEHKIRDWLDRPADGYNLDRLPDQMSGLYGSKNICDFILYKYPNMYYIESKATWDDRFDFSRITDNQKYQMLKKDSIDGVQAIVIVLFATYKRAFWISISEISRMESLGMKSCNIKKIDKWDFEYKEIKTISNSRKTLLDYDKEYNII